MRPIRSFFSHKAKLEKMLQNGHSPFLGSRFGGYNVRIWLVVVVVYYFHVSFSFGPPSKIIHGRGQTNYVARPKLEKNPEGREHK